MQENIRPDFLFLVPQGPWKFPLHFNKKKNTQQIENQQFFWALQERGGHRVNHYPKFGEINK